MSNWSKRVTPASLRGVGNRSANRGNGPVDPSVFAWVIVQVITGQPMTLPEPERVAKKPAEFRGIGIRAHGRYETRREGRIIEVWRSLLTMAGALFWHLVTPPEKHFLSDLQRSDLKTVLLSVIGSSAVSEAVKRALAADENSN